jgi:hypothetical protein
VGPGKFRQSDTVTICVANPDDHQRHTHNSQRHTHSNDHQRFTDTNDHQRFTNFDHGQSHTDRYANDPRWRSTGSGNGSVEQQPVVVE